MLLGAVAMKCEEDVVLEDFDDTIEPLSDRSRKKGRSGAAPADHPCRNEKCWANSFAVGMES